MKGYTKDDVESHSDRPYSRSYPAVNVKARNLPSVYKLADALKCTDEQAERALELAFEAAQSRFWNDDAPELVEHYFGKGHKFYSAGRSGGWLEVHTLGDPEEWDGVQLNRWALFERAVKQSVEYLTSFDVMLDDIQANRWSETGAELYNFVDTDEGSFCLVDVKATANSATREAYGLELTK